MVSARIARTQGVAAITLDGRDGPRQDEAFPDRFFARHTTFGGQRAFALRDAANEQDAKRSEQISAYSVTLAMFAIAVFLFGFSLTPEGRVRGGLFAGTAGALAVTGALIALVAGLGEQDAPAPEAADAYANGMVAASVGDTRRRREGVRPRDRAAADLRARVQGAFLRDLPGGLAAALRLPEPHAARRPAPLERRPRTRPRPRARQCGRPDQPWVRALPGGTPSDDQELVEEAAEISRRAVEADPRDPVSRFNLGVVLLALDREADALEAYRAGVPRVVFSDTARRMRRPGYAQEAILAGALTDLELLRRETGPRHAAAIRRIKAQIVGRITAGARPIPRSGARLSDFELSVFPTRASYLIHSEKGFKPSRDQLSLQWYHRDPKLGWGAVAELSGPAGSSEDDYGNDPVLNRRFDVVNYLELSPYPACLRPGRYRLEAYLNGRLADVAGVDASHTEPFEPEVEREVGMGICHPPGWRLRAPRNTAGVVSSWRSPDGSRGAVIMKLDRHRDGAMAGSYVDSTPSARSPGRCATSAAASRHRCASTPKSCRARSPGSTSPSGGPTSTPPAAGGAPDDCWRERGMTGRTWPGSARSTVPATMSTRRASRSSCR